MQNELARGAEAIIFSQDDSSILKRRPQKTYRIPEIDAKLRKARTRKESRILKKAASIPGLNTPNLILADDYDIVMEHIRGKKLRDVLDQRPELAKQIGEQLAILHDNDIIHSDLTTSNMILCRGKVYLIDFGLGYHSTRIEDKAVDIHLFIQALESRHHRIHENAYAAFLKAYQPLQRKQIMERLVQVRERGRHKKK